MLLLFNYLLKKMLNFSEEEIKDFRLIFSSYIPNLNDIKKLKNDLENKNLILSFPNLYEFTLNCLNSDNLIDEFNTIGKIKIKEELKNYSLIVKEEKKLFLENKKKNKSIKSFYKIKEIIKLNNNIFIIIDNFTIGFFDSINYQLITRVYIGELKNSFLKLKNNNLMFQYENYLMNLETKEFKLSRKINLKNELENYFIEVSNKLLIINNIEETLIYSIIHDNYIFLKLIDFIGFPFQLNLNTFILINKEIICQYSIETLERINLMENKSKNSIPFIYDENIILLYDNNGNGIIDIIDRKNFTKINSINFYYTGSTAHCFRITSVILSDWNTIIFGITEKIFIQYESNRFFLTEKKLSKNKNEFDDCSTIVINSAISSLCCLNNGNIIIGYLYDIAEIYG